MSDPFDANCDATTCTQCVSQADHCEWSNSGKYCYNWFDNPTNGANFKIECTSVFVPVIICIVVVIFICIAATVRYRRRANRRYMDSSLLNTPMIDNPTTIANHNYNQQQMYQPAIPNNYVQPVQPQYPRMNGPYALNQMTSAVTYNNQVGT
eukprot:344386_1